MLIVGVLISCEEASSGSDTEEAPETIIATMAKTGAGDIRAHYLAFTASTVDGSTSDYRLALRESTIATIPTSAEMNGNTAIVRSLSDTAINIYMSFHIDADLSTVSDITASYAARAAVMLKPATTYTLYVMKEGSADVKTMGQFTTDRAPMMELIAGLPAGDFSYRQGESLFVSGFVDVSADLASISLFIDDNTVENCFQDNSCLTAVMAATAGTVLSSDLGVKYPNMRTVKMSWSGVSNEITLQRQTQ